MNIKSIIAIALAAGVAVGIGFGMIGKNVNDTRVTKEQSQQLDPNDPHRVAEGAPVATMPVKPTTAPTEAPNFDTRKLEVSQKPAAAPLMSSEQSTEVMAQKQAEMENLIELYDQSLSDPKAKADLERKFKLHSEEYKKAILAKLKQDEL